MRMRRLAAVCGVTVLAVALTACGSKSTDTTKNAGHENANATLTKANFASTLTKAMSTEKSVHLSGTITAAGATFTINADTRLNGGSPSMKMEMGAGQQGTMQMILVGKAIYIKAPQLSQLSKDSSKPWMKIDLSNTSSPLGKSFSQLLDQADPSKMTQAFKALDNVKLVGSETVNGVATTHYRATVNLARALRAQGVDPSSLSGVNMPSTSIIDVWLDSQQRPAKVSMNMGDLAKVDMSFSKWGQPVVISAPAASQVTALNLGH